MPSSIDSYDSFQDPLVLSDKRKRCSPCPSQQPTMASLPSPASDSSPIPAPSSALKQPTYTTAGTIYNPSSSLPLQPPTRRGRSKWPIGSPHSELLLFPKSVLARMPIKPPTVGGGASVGAVAAGRPAVPGLQQYTPLQQNYDRAVSPFNDSEHASVNMSAQVPRMRSGNTPAPLAFRFLGKDDDRDNQKPKGPTLGEHAGAGNDNKLDEENNINEEGQGEDKEVKDDDDDDDDDDGDNMNPLLGMTVKSLHNLASYPNPNQKRAQKALLRGSRANLGSLASARLAPSPVALRAAGGSPDEPNNDGKPALLGLLRPAQLDGASKLDSPYGSTALLPTVRSPSPVASVEKGEGAPGATTLATGPGAPRPLTAGPPGQRQYRPSTFESTFKALQPKHQEQELSKEEAEGFAIAQQTLAHAGIDGLGLDPLTPSFGFGVATERTAAQPAKTKSALSTIVDGSEPDEPPYRGASYAGFASVGPPFPADRMLDMSWPRWCEPLFEARQYAPGSGRLTEEAIRARNARISSCWYAGTDLLGKSADDIMRDSRIRRPQHAYGAIGDGRPKKDNKPEYRPISVGEASRTPVSEHAKPLLNMALGTLVRQADDTALQGPLRPFATPDAALCEATAEGNRSHSSQPTAGLEREGE